MSAPADSLLRWWSVPYELVGVDTPKTTGKLRVRASDRTHAVVVAYTTLRRGTNAGVHLLDWPELAGRDREVPAL